ncbi:hypothetical protein [Heyndrickxia camelliae]|uniref:Uncharacterized protein n=1 Tax=Heyndrickxia camelliae TaxID=1707093 RepID=A0A2N3LJ86_9BACI|nr:hypothetical protein [Heyndrickxia camelliae]PKR84692.1 hypothetical protein CWO92_13375 [Heyndrickxia camelliae]
MKDYTYTKLLGIFMSVLTIIGAIGYGLLSLLGIGLANALNTEYEYSVHDGLPIIIAFICLLLGIITLIGSFWLKKKAGRGFFIGYCYLIGFGLVISFFISIGALGTRYELFILCMGMLYLLLGYLAYRRR